VYNVINVIVNDSFASQLLVDTGAASSCLSHDFVKSHSLLIIPLSSDDTHVFVVANNSTVRVIGLAKLSLNIRGEIFVHTFHVINNLSTDMLIGDDFLSTFQACVQRGKKI